ncbi:hypothetical protein ABBQ38_002690 [Trebouxia sp. C0009 RCD-2024]
MARRTTSQPLLQPVVQRFFYEPLSRPDPYDGENIPSDTSGSTEPEHESDLDMKQVLYILCITAPAATAPAHLGTCRRAGWWPDSVKN